MATPSSSPLPLASVFSSSNTAFLLIALIFHSLPPSPLPSIIYSPSFLSPPHFPLYSFPLVCNLPPYHPSDRLALSSPPFILSYTLYPFSIIPPTLCCSFTLSTLVVLIMQMSVCGGALKSRLGPRSLLIVTWLFHRGQQEGGISSCMCVCVGVCVCMCLHPFCFTLLPNMMLTVSTWISVSCMHVCLSM